MKANFSILPKFDKKYLHKSIHFVALWKVLLSFLILTILFIFLPKRIFEILKIIYS